MVSPTSNTWVWVKHGVPMGTKCTILPNKLSFLCIQPLTSIDPCWGVFRTCVCPFWPGTERFADQHPAIVSNLMQGMYNFQQGKCAGRLEDTPRISKDMSEVCEDLALLQHSLVHLSPSKAANVFLALETWGYLLSYIVGASMNISLLSTIHGSIWIPMDPYGSGDIRYQHQLYQLIAGCIK